MQDHVARLEYNAEALLAHLSAWPGWRVRVEPGLLWCESGILHEAFNKVIRCELPKAHAAQLLLTLREHFFARHAPLGFWLGPRSQPSNLRHILQELGFQPTLQAWGMVRPVSPRPGEAGSPELEIQEVRGYDLWSGWLQVFGRAFGLPAEARAAYGDQLAIGLAGDSLLHVAALSGGQVVGTGSLFVDDRNVAGIYNVATDTAARGQGIGEAVLGWLLREAQNRGCQWAVLRSTAAAYPFYVAAGFQPVARYDIYIARPPAAPL